MYKVEINNTKKSFNLTFEGVFTPTEVDAFLKEYQAKISSINSTDYILIANATNISISKQDMLPLMKNCFSLYMQTPFKKRYIVEGSSAVTNMQMKRVSKEINAEFSFIKSENEI